MGLLNHETNYFGLDIGSSAIRLVQLRGSGGKPVLVTYGDVKVPGGLTSSDAAGDRDKIADLVKQLIRDTRVGTKNVVAGLSSANVFASVITMPKLSNADIDKAIKYQADQYIPMPLDEVKVDWSLLGPGANDQEIEVLLVAAPIMATDKYLDILEKSGLEIVALEANATAVARALMPVSDIAVVILDVGSHASDLTIVYKNSPRLIRSIGIGAGTFVKAVAQNLNLNDEQAQQFTYRFGLTQSKLEGQVNKAIAPNVDVLVSEITKSIKFFAERYPQVKIEKLIVTGQGIAIPEYTNYMANSTGLPVEVGNSWINISYPASNQEKLLSVSSEYAVAAGLAQRTLV
ncbi:MAG TPA: type IV pilus assembly protein PilM [Candidatus Nanoarchaeia archaeon]|nr:type IV pilus assembly protein PilM [Candidatus Nanoarchaeia archaeon]